MKPEIPESRAETRLGRRAVLGAGIGGAAVSLLPLLTGKGSASSTSDGSTTTAGSTGSTLPTPTTDAPPRRPTDADTQLLGDAQRVELTARELYDFALNAGDWSDVETTVITTIREAHEAAAQALAGMLGNDAPGEMSDSLYNATVSGFHGATSDLLEAMYNLESGIVATHSEILGQLVGTDGATLIASVQSAEARHGTVLADLNGQTVVSTLLVSEEAEALSVNA